MASDRHDQPKELLYVCHNGTLKATQCYNMKVDLFCSEYLKRDDQILPMRLLQEERRDQMMQKAKERDRARNQDDAGDINGADIDMEDDAADDAGDALNGSDSLGSKVVVVHLGSQNLRIGLANDALPKTIPMVIARRSNLSESEEDGAEPAPKRFKAEGGRKVPTGNVFGEEVCTGGVFTGTVDAM